MKIYFDGGCQPNPGSMEACVFVPDQPGIAKKVVHYRLDHGTNNKAEWLALLMAATLADECGYPDVEFLGDSNLVVNQANGTWRCKDASLQSVLELYRTLANNKPGWRCTHVRRHLNLAGIHIEEIQKSR
jgi:ribonuclease HI